MRGKPVAFLTGASGGIGSAIATKLAADGYDLILHYNSGEGKVQELKETIQTKYGVDCSLFQADFTDIKVSMEKVTSLHVKPDVVVHNSGTSSVGLITDVTYEQLQKEISIGITMPFLLTQAFLPSMIKGRKGKIIVISSIWGLTGASCEVLYSTVKGGLNTFVKALAKEVAPSNIQVNGVAPGAIETPMLDHYDDEEIANLTDEIPAGRLGTPEEVASLVSFLVSDQSQYINGQIVSINGAWYC
ncbi:3-oxoacyl-[acyl-carrier protein] reductase [Evansella vedderi]|uniref:3-oxoacyl-[acyl-carrier protein] reductase n=1 Tax=Evansella vedderi TaxID=38282 RepID=A0ABT9ZQY1_9BACI|nr:SDR family oxidoreductase [Evansella vedderi]MDQ0253649.1 3-oxoacyl-[acyl-carrier protein] reductase [Evansella vedderi]